MQIDRIWAMPNHKTFEIKPIKQLILKELGIHTQMFFLTLMIVTH